MSDHVSEGGRTLMQYILELDLTWRTGRQSSGVCAIMTNIETHFKQTSDISTLMSILKSSLVDPMEEEQLLEVDGALRLGLASAVMDQMMASVCRHPRASELFKTVMEYLVLAVANLDNVKCCIRSRRRSFHVCYIILQLIQTLKADPTANEAFGHIHILYGLCAKVIVFWSDTEHGHPLTATEQDAAQQILMAFDQDTVAKINAYLALFKQTD